MPYAIYAIIYDLVSMNNKIILFIYYIRVQLSLYMYILIWLYYNGTFKFIHFSFSRTVYASYGGLMMALTADKQFIGDLEIDMKIYLLAKNVDIEIV